MKPSVFLIENGSRNWSRSPAEAAHVCGVSVRTFSDWLKSPDNPPPHFRRGGVILVPRRELERWLANQAAGASGERAT